MRSIRAFQATARCIAPVSMCRYPRCSGECARNSAAPDGPSMAMMRRLVTENHNEVKVRGRDGAMCDGASDGARVRRCFSVTCGFDAIRSCMTLFAVAVIVSASAYFAMPCVRAASLFVRVGNVGGPLERLADAIARDVTVLPRQRVLRHGEVETQLYRPEGTVRRSVLLVPGVHSMGIAEPRLTALAHDLAGSGVAVMTMALPDLMAYQITARSADVIEDVVAWMAAQPELAPDGRVGMIGISFAGGLSIVAAGRSAIRDKVAYVVSFGGHGDLGRVLHYLATGEAVQAPGVKTIPPHDYGVDHPLCRGRPDGSARAGHAAARGNRNFLLASQLTSST